MVVAQSNCSRMGVEQRSNRSRILTYNHRPTHNASRLLSDNDYLSTTLIYPGSCVIHFHLREGGYILIDVRLLAALPQNHSTDCHKTRWKGGTQGHGKSLDSGGDPDHITLGLGFGLDLVGHSRSLGMGDFRQIS